ncbi:prephenate/arogenate dehydrogenase family protein [Hyphomonas sp. FCG-A18]|jgi:cyclohexadieny/prephenate dehydrogenase|uniref:prephenate/arogenate dehydrogenase family protein n=1 Tax=Hyphomonas sp. FCG-A18 TaxID=3080019 RepID=UPI002B2F1D5E|nr:prephenate/arogenate dehydrogenase family protein [Hyphomonas sp. FCG-A18]
MSDPVFNRVAIIGIGLLGSSIAHAVKAYGGADEVRLWDRDEDVRARAARIVPGIVTNTAAEVVQDADCIILCTPVGTLASVTETIAPHLKDGAILTDVGSVKAKAAADMSSTCPDHVHLIPGHPIAGTEKSGPEAGFASLFQDAWHILTPQARTDTPYVSAQDRLSAFWATLGARVETMDAARHDRVLAITSHLPHLIAYNIVSTAHDMESVEEGEVVKYSAGGFRDFTRIAASDPTMWRDVFLTNKEAVLETLGRFSEDLAALQRAIRWGDGDTLMKEFTRARGIRKAIIEAGLDTAEADFGRRKDD